MELFLIDNDCKYAAEQIMLMLFPEERPVYPEKPSGAFRAELRLYRGKKRLTCVCRMVRGGQQWEGRAAAEIVPEEEEILSKRLRQRVVKLAFYRAGIRCLGKKPVWGALSGIRPAKLMTGLLDSGLSERAAVSRFRRLYDVSPERAELCLDAAKAGRKAVRSLEEKDICLYVGIPFCPTRCAYCSFVSSAVEKSMGLLPEFLSALVREIEATAAVVRELDLRPVSLYIGGGTPTTLSPEQLDRLCRCLESNFDFSALREFTVEAGRPDTVTPEALETLKARGVSRLSVNPQSMSEQVLQAIGRRHSAADVLNAMALARKTGGFAVNMDLIAGLPGDSLAGFASTLDQCLDMNPENLTVHTLSLKKGSRIMLESTPLPGPEEVGRMLDLAGERLRTKSYAPYYLYRQKYMSGGFENVGWCLPGRENLYNICIMEELCSVLAMGGGASTKLVFSGGRIERIFAPKYPQEYICGIEKVCRDKEKIKTMAENAEKSSPPPEGQRRRG